MKFIISKSTVDTLNAQTAQLAALVNPDGDYNPVCFFEEGTRPDATQYANHSITLVNGEYVLEINDEGSFKYMALYLKIARIVQPFIKPVMALMATIESDLEDIARFFNQKK